MLTLVKLIEYIFSADNECLPNPCVGHFPRIKISFFLLSILVDELISSSKIITFLLVPPLGCEKNPSLSNPIPYPKYLHLSMSAFLVNLTAPNNEIPSEGWLFHRLHKDLLLFYDCM